MRPRHRRNHRLEPIGLSSGLGQINCRQVAALGGVVPFNRHSATLRGKRTVWGGRAALRRVLCTAALHATRGCTRFASFYRRLIEKGKPHKVALTAVMHQLLIFAYSLLKNIKTPRLTSNQFIGVNLTPFPKKDRCYRRNVM